MDALNQPAKLVVRANTLKVTRQQLKDKLAEAEIATTELGADALVLHTRKNLYNSPPFKEGWMEIQDYSSQQVAPFLDVAPGMRVIDACAGAGGKTLHLAALMHNKGRIIALDTEAWKLDELKRRARRAGVGLAEIRPIANNKVIKRLTASADRVLIDAPCSGLGVLRRNPDAKWKLTEEFVGNLRQTQQKILHSYSQMVKPGGKTSVRHLQHFAFRKRSAGRSLFTTTRPEIPLVGFAAYPATGRRLRRLLYGRPGKT
jgi:16S rRNA (cytosine967-C5)-methyltransferase